MILWAFLLALLTGKPLCSVKVDPAIAFAPVRFVQIKAQVEPHPEWRVATLALLEPDGTVVRVSDIWDQTGGVPAPKTTWVEWRTLALVEPGEYGVVLTVTSPYEGRGCMARSRVVVTVPEVGQ